MENTIKFTALGKGYWEGEGAYNEEYTKLYDELVPASGCSKTLFGELIRAASRLGYDYYNNGNCNAADITYIEEEGYEDEETGEWIVEQEEDREVSIAPFYAAFIDLLEETICCVNDEQLGGFAACMDDVRNIIIDNGYDYRNRYKDTDNNIYDKMTDYVMYFVLNHPELDKPLSEVEGYANYEEEN